MSSISLVEKLGATPMSEFKFTSFLKKVTTDDQTGKRMVYFELTLEEPIEQVIGTNGIWHLRKLVPYTKKNVDIVRCSFDDIKKYHEEFTFEEDSKGKLTGAGSYSGDMILDVSKGQHVWLKAETFAYEARQKRKANESEVISQLIADSAGTSE